jgi:hypothetical protein
MTAWPLESLAPLYGQEWSDIDNIRHVNRSAVTEAITMSYVDKRGSRIRVTGPRTQVWEYMESMHQAERPWYADRWHERNMSVLCASR